MQRAFHPIAIAVCTSEAEKDFRFIFTAVRQGIQNIFDVDYIPDYLIGDAAAQIHNGGIAVWPNILVIMCWYHMHRAVADKVPSFLKELNEQAEFMSDLEKLQVAKTPAIFEIALQLFLDKWRNQSEELIDYFEHQWVLRNRNWFEAFAKNVPSNNNALESRNRLIKDEHTLRDRMDLGKFRVALFDMVQAWSLEYTTGDKIVATESADIELKMWTAGYQFAKSNVKITSRRRGNTIIYRTAQAERVDDSTDWDDFDSFKKKSFDFHDTTFVYPTRKDNWLNSECDCSDYLKLYVCCHIIGISIRLKYITPPAEAKSVPIGQKRKRGRPAKAKPALVRQ